MIILEAVVGATVELFTIIQVFLLFIIHSIILK